MHLVLVVVASKSHQLVGPLIQISVVQLWCLKFNLLHRSYMLVFASTTLKMFMHVVFVFGISQVIQQNKFLTHAGPNCIPIRKQLLECLLRLLGFLLSIILILFYSRVYSNYLEKKSNLEGNNMDFLLIRMTVNVFFFFFVVNMTVNVLVYRRS